MIIFPFSETFLMDSELFKKKDLFFGKISYETCYSTIVFINNSFVTIETAGQQEIIYSIIKTLKFISE